MPILLDHVIVPSHDQSRAAQFLAELLDVPWEMQRGHFSPVFVNETLTLDFGDWEGFEFHHYAFHVTDAEFDAIFARIQAAGLKYGSGPFTSDDMEIYTGLGRIVYWRDPTDEHLWEILTESYARIDSPLPAAAGS